MPAPERASLAAGGGRWGRGKPDGPGGLAQNGAVARIAAGPRGRDPAPRRGTAKRRGRGPPLIRV